MAVAIDGTVDSGVTPGCQRSIESGKDKALGQFCSKNARIGPGLSIKMLDKPILLDFC